MATLKNNTRTTHVYLDKSGAQVVVAPDAEVEIDLTEERFKVLKEQQELAEAAELPCVEVDGKAEITQAERVKAVKEAHKEAVKEAAPAHPAHPAAHSKR
jgi:phosphoenolpyruvate-protein kinase (PTS system EI component)